MKDDQCPKDFWATADPKGSEQCKEEILMPIVIHQREGVSIGRDAKRLFCAYMVHLSLYPTEDEAPTSFFLPY